MNGGAQSYFQYNALKFVRRRAFIEAVKGKLNFTHENGMALLNALALDSIGAKTRVEIKCFAHFVRKLDFSIFTNCKYAFLAIQQIYTNTCARLVE